MWLGGSNNFNAPGNWSTNTVPTGTASFGASGTTSLSITAPATLGITKWIVGQQ